MPLEGHWQRVNTPLRETTPRERLIVRAFAGVVAIAVLATVIVLVVTSGGSSSSPGCVKVDVPSTMGGSGINACGKDARTFCDGPLAHSSALRGAALPACREAGY